MIHWHSSSQVSKSLYFLINSMVSNSEQGNRSLGFFLRIARMNSLNSGETFLGNSTSSVTWITQELQSLRGPPVSWCWKDCFQRLVHRPALQQPKGLLSHRIFSLAVTQEKGTMEFRRMLNVTIIFCSLPIRNHRVWRFPNYSKKYMDKNNIFRFDISVKNLMFMHEGDSIKKITNDKCRALLWETLSRRHDII